MALASEIVSSKDLIIFGINFPLVSEMGGIINLSHLNIGLMVLRRRGLS